MSIILKLMNQTHSNKVVVINKQNVKNKSFKSDAIITNLKGYALGVCNSRLCPNYSLRC